MSENSGLKRPYLLQQFSALPREIVDEILDHLTLFKVLQLATWADPVIAAQILEHKHYGRTFRSAAHLSAAASRFAIWREVKIACGWRNDRHLFAINPMSSLFSGVTHSAFMGDMDADIKEGYRRASVYRHLLSNFSSEPFSPGLIRGEPYKKHLQNVWSAQEAIKQLESQLLMVLARFLDTYPDMLRWAHDPRGNTSTIPPEHIIKRLRICAEKVSNTQYMRLRKPVHCKFAFQNGIVPIVPRDWCLQLLLRSDLPDEVMQRITDQRTGLEEQTDALQDIHLTALSPQPLSSPSIDLLCAEPAPAAAIVQCPTASSAAGELQQSPPLSQQDAAIKDLHTVFKGLTHRYARPGHKIDGTPIARISITDRFDIGNWFTKSCSERQAILEHGEPCFVVHSRAEFFRRAENVAKKEGYRRGLRGTTKEEGKLSVQPHHPQELEWLGAFLRSVAYLKEREQTA